MTDRYVLDSFAVLAYLQDERGAEDVESLLEAAAQDLTEILMPVVNLGEAAYITEREQSLEAAQRLLGTLEQLPVAVKNIDRTLTLDAAHIKAHNRISYADAFAVALARHSDAVVVTGDPEFAAVEHVIDIYWLSQ